MPILSVVSLTLDTQWYPSSYSYMYSEKGTNISTFMMTVFITVASILVDLCVHLYIKQQKLSQWHQYCGIHVTTVALQWGTYNQVSNKNGNCGGIL